MKYKKKYNLPQKRQERNLYQFLQKIKICPGIQLNTENAEMPERVQLLKEIKHVLDQMATATGPGKQRDIYPDQYTYMADYLDRLHNETPHGDIKENKCVSCATNNPVPVYHNKLMLELRKIEISTNNLVASKIASESLDIAWMNIKTTGKEA